MLQVHNGPMEFGLQQDKCLDMAYLRYKGVNLTPLSPPGLQGRNPSDTRGKEAVRSIMIGAMFTSGFQNIHSPRVIDGTEYPMHGRMRSTPMEKVCMDASFQGERYVLQTSGEGREACLLGENMVLRRSVTTEYGSREIHITDVIENQSFHPEKLCFLYHCNGGYPFLQEGCRFIIPHHSVVPRNENARCRMDSRTIMPAPAEDEPDTIYIYEPAADEAGNTFAAMVNDDMQLALCVRWNVHEIPMLNQWKCPASGNYMAALEPANEDFQSRAGEHVEVLQPHQTHVNHITLAIAEGEEAISELDREKSLLEA